MNIENILAKLKVRHGIYKTYLLLDGIVYILTFIILRSVRKQRYTFLHYKSERRILFILVLIKRNATEVTM